MKRTPLKRRAPIRPGRRKPRPADVYGEYHRWIKTLPCTFDGIRGGCFGPIDGHHVRSVGAGGKDFANEIPVCRTHHREIHDRGPGVFGGRPFLERIADRLAGRFPG